MREVCDRRHRRLPAICPAELLVGGRRIPATIHTLSSGGVGLELAVWAGEDPCRGESVKIRVPIDGNTVELPGRVAWRSKELPRLGVRLQLEAAGSEFRGAYERWMARLIEDVDAPARPRTIAAA